MKTCLYYNEDKNIMDNNGINTEYVEFDGIEYIKCIPKHLSSFTIGSLDKELIQKSEKKSIALNLVILFIIILCVWYVFITYKRKKNPHTYIKLKANDF